MKITYEELMLELEKYATPSKADLTNEQIAFIKKARSKNVSWPNIIKLWNKFGWLKISQEGLRKKYLRTIEN